jgi:hypothetical protein
MRSGFVIARTNPPEARPISTSGARAHMLLPSILRILDQNQIQPKVIDKPKPGFEAELSLAAEGMAGSANKNPDLAVAGESVNPANFEGQSPERIKAASNLEELLKIITKFQKSNQSRVVDVFE